MPRGDDTQAHAEFDAAAVAQYGIHSNAQELIEAHRRSVNPAVQKASLLQVDEEATAEARDDLDDVASRFDLDDDVKVLDVAVRGNALIAAVEHPNGFIEKLVTGWNDKYVAPKLTPEQEADQVKSASDAQVAREVARLRAEFDQRLAEAKDDLSAQLSEQFARLRDDAASEVAAKPPKDDGELPADEDLALDDEEKLERQLTKPQLEELAARHGVEVASGDTKATLAEKIVETAKQT